MGPINKAASDLDAIREQLRNWDPIGVYSGPISDPDDPWPDDEYDNYAPRVLAHLQGGADPITLASYLAEVRTSSMGLSPDPESDRTTAETLCAWWSARD